jgi:MtrB/PioB family decaheme-associated outer membrane protein
MKTQLKQFLNVSVLVFLALPLATLAQDTKDEDSKAADKTEAKVEKKSTVDNEIDVGIYYLDDDSYRYGKYTGITDSGAYALFDFRLEKRPKWDSGDLTRWRFEGWRVGLDSRRLEFDFREQGKQRFTVDYRQTPNNNWRNGESIYLGMGGNDLTLPDGWDVVPGSNNTRGFYKLDEYLSPVKMKTERKSMRLEYALKLGSNWNMTIDYKHEVKDGTRATWAVIGYDGVNARSVGIAAPVDWNTDNFEAMFSYASGRFQFGAGIYASFFKNDEKSVSWETAYGKGGRWEDGTGFPEGTGQMSLEPDNSYLQFKMYGGMNFGRSTRVTADFSYGSMKQDDAFLPYTINDNLRVRTPLPQTDADAKINMTMLNLRLTSRLARSLNLSVNYVYDDRDNKTSRAAAGYPYVPGDSINQLRSSEARLNLPYSYTNQELGAVLNWRLGRGVGLKGGVTWNDYSRTYSEVNDADEITYVAGISFRRLQTASFRLDYNYSDRDIDEYVDNRPFQLSHLPGTVDEDAWQNHPYQRKYNQTDRKRTEWRFRMDWFPTTEFNFGLTGLSREDEYDENAFGLNEAESNSWTIDAGWYPSEKIELSGFYTKEQWESEMAGQQFTSFQPNHAFNPDWSWWNESEDDVDTYNLHLGFKNYGKSEGIHFGLDYTFSNVESLFTTTAGAKVPTGPLPELVSKLRSFTVYADFDFGEKSTIRLAAENSKLRMDDFSIDNIEPDTMASVLSFGQATPDYDIVLISASWRYRF